MTKKPWCCHIDQDTKAECPNDATQRITYGNGPGDQSDMCDEHAPALIADTHPYLHVETLA